MSYGTDTKLLQTFNINHFCLQVHRIGAQFGRFASDDQLQIDSAFCELTTPWKPLFASHVQVETFIRGTPYAKGVLKYIRRLSL